MALTHGNVETLNRAFREVLALDLEIEKLMHIPDTRDGDVNAAIAMLHAQLKAMSHVAAHASRVAQRAYAPGWDNQEAGH